MNHLWRGKAFPIPGPLSSYGVGGPSWGSLFTIPGSYKPGMPGDSNLVRLMGTLLGETYKLLVSTSQLLLGYEACMQKLVYRWLANSNRDRRYVSRDFWSSYEYVLFNID